MPRRQPFTLLCQAAARIANPRRADLHAHTTASDGDFTPSQLVVHARNAGLVAIAITDHDTTAGFAEARTVANSFEVRPIEVLAGVEVSTHFEGRHFHLLGYFFDDTNAALQRGLAGIRARRRERFRNYLEGFAANGVQIAEHLLAPLQSNDIAVGRRHLAKLLVESGHANTLHIAFLKHIHPQNIPASHNVPLELAIDWLHNAGGIASLAHPPADLTRETLSRLHAAGLDAVEANFPSGSYGFSLDLAEWARSLGLGTTAGSDYHGGSHVLGSRTITAEQLDELRRRSGRTGSAVEAASRHS